MWAADLNDLAIFAKTVKSFSIFEDCELHVRVYVQDFLRPSFLPLGLDVPDHLNRVRSRPTFRWCSCRCCKCLLLDRCRVATLPCLSKPLYTFQIQYTICVLTRNYLRLGGRLLLRPSPRRFLRHRIKPVRLGAFALARRSLSLHRLTL
jgi:hypothetical protein